MVAPLTLDVDEMTGRLVAYVVARDGVPRPSTAQLREFLAQRVPAAALPSIVVWLDELPRLPSGKLDRRALPAPVPGRDGLSTPYVAPSGPVEPALCRIVADTLDRPSVGVHDEFWELGGDSLQAVRVMGAVRRTFAVELGVRALFEDPTMARLAARVERARASTADTGPAELRGIPRDGAPAISTAQARHWFLQALDPHGCAYNICDTLRITGPLDIAALEAALAAVVQRHEILRTRYHTVDGHPVPRVAATGQVSMPVADLRGLAGAADAQRRVAAELLAGDRDRPFDLSQLPLLRARLVRLDEEEHWLGIVAHHIVADDWAFNVLYDELSAGYAGAHRPPLDVQYADYAVWERRMLAERLDAGLGFWRGQLADAPTAAVLPVLPSRPGSGEDPARAYRFEIPEPLAERWQAWCRTRSVTLFAGCLAALAVALGRRTGAAEVPIGVPFVNRERPELERLIGCFINPAVIRVDLSSTALDEVVARVADTLGPAYATQYVPYERVAEAVRQDRHRAGRADAAAPLFEVVLNFVPAPVLPRLAGAHVVRLDEALPRAAAKYPVTLYLEKTERTLRGNLVYAPDRLTPADAAALADAFIAVLDETGAP